MYKLDPGLYTLHWLLRQNKDEEIAGMNLSTDAVNTMTDIPACISIQDIQEATQNDIHLQALRKHIIRDWQSKRNEPKQSDCSGYLERKWK